MRVGVTGATGFVGRRLGAELLARGWEVVGFTRDPTELDAPPARRRLPAGVRAALWNPLAEPAPRSALDGLDALVNLAGEPIAALRWSAERRRRIRESRVRGTRNLVAGLAGLSAPPRVLVSGSAVGYYGDRGDEPLDEGSPPGRGFLAETCVAWEAEAERAASLGLRVVRLRTGIVLGPGGGLLQTMLLPFRLGLGGTLGGGRQWAAWVHLADEVGLILHALEHEQVRGPLNAVAPSPATNADFTRALGEVLGRPTFFRVPAPALRLLLGQVADELLLSSQRARPSRALATGYVFRYPELRPALAAAVAGEPAG